MNYGFICFVSSVLILGIAFALAFKPIFINMVGMAAAMVPTHGLAYFQCLIKTAVVMGICFRETWQPVTIEQVARWQWWDWTIYLCAPLLAGLINVDSFLNRSLERADAAKAAKNGLSKPPFPPTTPPIP